MPISDCEVRDPRIRRTRQLLQGALRDLMQTKNIDEISVQDITDAATVNRATFYDHYTDKFALLDAMVASGFHMLLHERNVSFDGTCPSAASAIILATCDYLTQTHSNTTECTRHNAFEPLMEAAIVTAIRYVLMKGMPIDGAPAKLSPEIVATTASWAIYGAVKQWFYTPDHLPAAEIVPPILQLVVPILMAAGSPSTPELTSHA
ncbi:MAG: transcriptional regulator, TetR family [Edaphobacter sp.]|nr:transcriptional regulator, TetR family [Edaphobacter sp.]